MCMLMLILQRNVNLPEINANYLQEIQRRLTERSYLLAKQQQEDSEQAIGFIGACRIPGVIEFSSCLFFSKLVSYTFLYWLPLYVKSSSKIVL